MTQPPERDRSAPPAPDTSWAPDNSPESDTSPASDVGPESPQDAAPTSEATPQTPEATPQTPEVTPTTGEDTPTRKRRGRLVALIAVAATLVCAVGGVAGYLLLRDADRGEGAADPTTAVHDFLKSVYMDRDAGRAASLTCPEARDEDKLAGKVQEVADLTNRYEAPRFRWAEPKLDEQDAERALVSTTLTMTTGDERTVDQPLAFVVVEETGWWICDVVQAVPAG